MASGAGIEREWYLGFVPVSRDEPCRPYRVAFEGGDIPLEALGALREEGVVWELSRGGVGPWHHTMLTRADSEEVAIARVGEVVARYGNFDGFGATVVTDGHGEEWQGPVDTRWAEVDWSIPARRRLTRLQRDVLGALLNDHEPVWTILRDPDVDADRRSVEVALAELETAGLVDRRMARSMGPESEPDVVPWWAITNEGWDLLGLVKSPRYR